VQAALRAAQARAPAQQALRAGQQTPATARVLQRVANYAPGSAAVRTPMMLNMLLNQPQQSA
jgi:hypothetical protein